MTRSQRLSQILAALAFATAASPVLAAVHDVEGTYTVPAGAGLNKPFDVALERARFSDDHGFVQLDYRLPKELDGATPQRFRLAGRIHDGAATLSDTRGDSVTAECTLTPDAYVCHMTYKQPFTVDQAGALAYLQARGTLPVDIEKMQRAADSLQHQAAGIVTIPRGH